MERDRLIIIRGGGDIASGTIHRLHRCGFRLLVLEATAPTAIRRTVSFAEAIYEKRVVVENVTAERIVSLSQASSCWERNRIPVLADPEGRAIAELRPWAVVDAILAKKNCGTTRDMADITVALGPGFTAGEDVDMVVETARGHDLGRVIYMGSPRPNTGIPGPVAGYTSERVMYAPVDGHLSIVRDIGRKVEKGQVMAMIDEHPVVAPFSGTVRGMIRHGRFVGKGLKVADVDPRAEAPDYCRVISDKARCISGGVLEALFSHHRHFSCDNRSRLEGRIS